MRLVDFSKFFCVGVCKLAYCHIVLQAFGEIFFTSLQTSCSLSRHMCFR